MRLAKHSPPKIWGTKNSHFPKRKTSSSQSNWRHGCRFDRPWTSINMDHHGPNFHVWNTPHLQKHNGVQTKYVLFNNYLWAKNVKKTKSKHLAWVHGHVKPPSAPWGFLQSSMDVNNTDMRSNKQILDTKHSFKSSSGDDSGYALPTF